MKYLTAFQFQMPGLLKNKNEKELVKMKKRILLYFTVIVLSQLIFAGIIDSVRISASSGGMTRIQFIKSVVSVISDNEGKKENGLSIKIYKSGKVRINQEVIPSEKAKALKKKYGLSLKNAGYLCSAIELGLVGEKEFKTYKSGITYKEMMIILGRAETVINGKIFSDDDVKYVMENRISNISSIKKNKERVEAAKGYMTGIFTGKSDGSYSGTRSVRFGSHPSQKTIKKILKKLSDEKQRDVFSDDWQVTRTKGLPRNAGLYSVIISDIPNDYYDTGFNGWTTDNFQTEGPGKNTLRDRVGTTIGPLFVYPKEIEEFNALSYPDDFDRRGLQYQVENRNSEIGKELVKGAKEFYRLALNVDYRTIEKDVEWKEAMGRFLSEGELQDYINHCIENRTIIECDLVGADYSSVYYYDGEYNCKVYAHMRIVSDIPIEKMYFTAEAETKYGYLYPLKKGWSLGSHYTRIYFSPQYLNYRLGEWTDYYFNAIGARDIYGCLNCSNASTSLMIDYSGCFPWLTSFPYRNTTNG